MDGRTSERTGRLPDGSAARIAWTDGIIQDVSALPGGADVSATIAPALVDIQVNGYGGYDINSPTVEASDVIEMARIVWSTGVGSFLPTVVTGSHDRMSRSIRTVREACSKEPLVAESVVGLHIEGPYISPEDGPRGAHPKDHVRPPDWDEFRRWQDDADGTIRLITLSPEWNGANAFIERATASGVRVALGHTQASARQIHDAVEAGASLSTHLGNGAHAVLPRHPNYIWEQLADDRLWASFIADGHHLPPATIKCMIRAKSPERTILTSDAVALAGMAPGRYEGFESRAVEVSANGRVTLAGTPYLAGAGLPLIDGVANAMRWLECSLAEAWRMATANPASFIDARPSARLEPGEPADLVMLRADAHGLTVVETVVAGETVFTEDVSE